MNNRRKFLKTIVSVSAAGSFSSSVNAIESGESIPPNPGEMPPAKPAAGIEDRAYWVAILQRIANPVLEKLVARELRKAMPVETNGDRAKAVSSTHLEAFSRTLVGISPWLEVQGLTGDEERTRNRLLNLVRLGLDSGTDPASPDFFNFHTGSQPLVDAAFLAQALLRAPRSLWGALEKRVQSQIIAGLKASRTIKPGNNNWVLFAALVEAALLEFCEPTLEQRLEDNVRTMLKWYLGDGIYGDGPEFHFDYYNSFVIHPALVDILGVLKKNDDRFEEFYRIVIERARRFAQIQEKLISPEGTFPAIGRSMAYRFGSFHVLGQMALIRQLPETIKPAQARCALTAVIRRMMVAPGTFDENGWLQVGFYGHQPAMGDSYISTGSLYLCCAGFTALGLPPDDAFWSGTAAKWTAQKIWAGENVPGDHALHETHVLRALPSLKR